MKISLPMKTQVGFLINNLLLRIYHFLWLLIHFLYRSQSEIRERVHRNWRLALRRLLSCFPAYSYYGELAALTQATESLRKTPKHIAFSVIMDDEPVDLQLLAKVISWAWAGRIPVVSLYDYEGRLKKSYRELGCYVQEELIQNFWALKKFGRANEPPSVKFHNIPKINGYSNGIGSNGTKAPSSPLHIVLLSHEDGKPDIIRAAKRLYFEHLQLNKADSTSSDPVEIDEDSSDSNGSSAGELSIKGINESKLDALLNNSHASWSGSTGVSSEPDILVIFGSIKSTLGFLPWHIRLTEIHWLPKLDIVETRDILAVLQKYSGCQQRFGT